MKIGYLMVLLGVGLSMAGCPEESASPCGNTTTSSSTGGSGGAGGSGGSGGGCVSCSAAEIGADPSTLCTNNGPPSSLDLYDAAGACICGGACLDVCGDNLCSGQDRTTECEECVTDPLTGCGTEVSACDNDM